MKCNCRGRAGGTRWGEERGGGYKGRQGVRGDREKGRKREGEEGEGGCRGRQRGRRLEQGGERLKEKEEKQSE